MAAGLWIGGELNERDIDRQIALIMGDRLIYRGKWRGYWDCGGGRHYSDEDGGPLHYSTDMAAAWLVIERLREYAPVVEYYPDGSGTASKQWRVIFTKIPNVWGHVLADADTAPLAICLAVLEMEATKEQSA
jgi:hypothetical protein